MKQRKRMAAIMLAGTMLIGMNGFSARAAEIQPRSPLCPKCSIAMLPEKKSDPWAATSTSNCIHGFKKGYDAMQQRKVWQRTACPKCKLGYPWTLVRTETRRICNGYD